jgi:hypothetical protein
MKIEFTPSLTHFDLGNNIQLQFDSTHDFDQFLNKLKKIKLEYITIDQDCIKEHEGLSKLINQIKSIKQINGDDKGTMQKKIDRQRELEANKEFIPQMTEADDQSDEEEKGANLKIEGLKKKDRIVPPPNLQNLLFNLEAANSHPSDALKHLKQLAKDVDKVLENTDIAE